MLYSLLLKLILNKAINTIYFNRIRKESYNPVKYKLAVHWTKAQATAFDYEA